MGEDLPQPPVQYILENPDLPEPYRNLSNCVQLDGNVSVCESAILQQPVPKIDKITYQLIQPTIVGPSIPHLVTSK